VVVVTTPDDVAVMDTYAAIKLSTTEAITSNERILINQSESNEVAEDIKRRLSTACQRFLQRDVPALPAVPKHAASDLRRVGRTPRVWESPNSAFGHAVLWLAHAVEDVISEHPAAEVEAREGKAPAEPCSSISSSADHPPGGAPSSSRRRESI
jgi:MinD-like ATPase involved in chromosome partitioning or flagellar assembly